jgi:hypothetical protein
MVSLAPEYPCDLGVSTGERLAAPDDAAPRVRTSSRGSPAPSSLRRVLPAVLCGAALTGVLRADEPPRPPAGEVQLGAGRVVAYTIHFDRNSLRDSLHLGDGLIALTSSGTLLRFELPAVRLVRERIGVVDVTCLGRGEGDAVLAGLADGRVCRVDPATLDLADVVKLPAAPQWVGWGKARGNRPAGLVVVTRPTKPVERDGRHWDVPYSVVHDLATGKTFTEEEAATTCLLDRAGRVWLGADRGEWGGWVTRVDLVKGTTEAIKPPPSHDPAVEPSWQGVYGFIELRDGQVWAFGGTSHMGFNQGEITRVDVPQPRTLFAFEPPKANGKEPDPGRPRLPITHVLEEDGGLLVFSYSDVFRVDRAFSSWKRAATIHIKYRWGRPDAVGAYPSVSAVHPPRRPGDPYLLATIGDGYVSLEGGKTTPHGLPGQLGASGITAVKNTSEGTFFFEADERLPVWRLGAKGWEVAALAPPSEPDPASASFEGQQKSWYETRVLVGTDRTIYTVSGTSVSPGTRTTAHRVGGNSVRIGRETSSLDPSASFLTADGTLWNAFFGELNRFDKGRWETVARLPEGESPFDLDPLNTNGPPWLLLDRYGHDLWRLEPGAQGENPRLTRVRIGDGQKSRRISDAIPWSDAALLLATDAGLRTYTLATRTTARTRFPEPAQPASTLVRDGLGRFWLGSDQGLWLSEPGAKAPEPLDRVPWVGRGGVRGFAPDPQHVDGVIVALGSRGVAFVRASRKPERRSGKPAERASLH